MKGMYDAAYNGCIMLKRNMEGIVTLTCASWFENEDGNVHILNSYGSTVILNKLYSEVWKEIDSEEKMEVLEEKLKDKIDSEQLEEIVKDFLERDLVIIRESLDSFDALF